MLKSIWRKSRPRGSKHAWHGVSILFFTEGVKELIKLTVKTIAMAREGSFSLLLADSEQKTILPISIGAFEAQAIALPLEGKPAPRPLTHDLIVSFCEALRGTVEKIVITDIREDTYYAEIELRRDGEVITLDARPSDAVALALRFDAPIYMKPGLVEFTINYKDLFSEGEES